MVNAEGNMKLEKGIGSVRRWLQFQIEWPYLVSLKKWYLNKDPKKTNEYIIKTPEGRPKQ